MTMNMCIVMNMNIYITKENTEFLKALSPGESMSGLVNQLLDDYRGGVKLSYHDVPNKSVRAAVQTKAVPLPHEPVIIKTKDDAVETIKQLFPEAKVIEPLYRDKKNKKL